MGTIHLRSLRLVLETKASTLGLAGAMNTRILIYVQVYTPLLLSPETYQKYTKILLTQELCRCYHEKKHLSPAEIVAPNIIASTPPSGAGSGPVELFSFALRYRSGYRFRARPKGTIRGFDESDY